MHRRELLGAGAGFLALSGCLQDGATSDPEDEETPVPVRRTATGGPPAVEWRREYGTQGRPATYTENGNPGLRANSLLRAPGGFVVTGEARTGGIDAYVQKLDQSGGTTWIHVFGRESVNTEDVYQGDGPNRGKAIARAEDGGYVVVGSQPQSQSAGDGGSDSTGWAAKLDPGGSVAWHIVPDGQPWGSFEEVVPTGDGGYALTGWRRGADGIEGWFATLTAEGSMTTDAGYDTGTDTLGEIRNGFHSVTPAGDGGFLHVGKHAGGAWLLRAGPDGTTYWERRLEDPFVVAKDAVETADGHFLVTGRRRMADQSATYTITNTEAHPSDLFLSRVTPDGEVEWTRTHDGGANEIGNAVVATADGGYLVAGTHKRHRNEGIFLCKTRSDGSAQWTESYLTEEHVEGTDVVQAPDGGFVVTGRDSVVKFGDTATPTEKPVSPTETGTWSGSDTATE